MTKREILDIIEVAPGEFRGVVEVEADATGWTVLSDHGYVYEVLRPRTLTLVQADAKRWLLLEDGEITPASYRERDLPQVFEAMARAAYPLATRAYQWTAGRPVKSLAEWKRSVAKRFAV